MFGFYRLIFIGCFLNAGLANVITLKEQGKASETYDDIIQNNDYDEYSDDEDSPPEQLRTTTSSNMSTITPYFDVEEKKVYQKAGQPMKLFCPVKNFDDARQQILWYKGDYPITNGHQSLNDIYQVDVNFNLVLEKTSKDTLGSYYCRVMPQNVKLHINVQADDSYYEIVTNSNEVSPTPTTSSSRHKIVSNNIVSMLFVLVLMVSVVITAL